MNNLSKNFLINNLIRLIGLLIIIVIFLASSIEMVARAYRIGCSVGENLLPYSALQRYTESVFFTFNISFVRLQHSCVRIHAFGSDKQIRTSHHHFPI